MKKITLVAVFIILGVAGIIWLSRRETAPDAGEAEAAVAAVETVELKAQTLSQTVAAFGIVAADPEGEKIMVAPYDAIVRKVLVSPGKRVGPDETLLELEPNPETKLAFDTARSAVGLAEKALEATRERFALKLATNQDVLAAEQAETEARLRVDALGARGVGGDGKMRTPSAGIVTKMELNAGTSVAAGTPLATVAFSHHLEARLAVEARDLPLIKAGQSLTLRSANRAAISSVVASIRTVGAALDQTSGTGEARAALPDSDALFPGEHVVAEIEVAVHENVLVVPRSAVLSEKGTACLFTVAKGHAKRHEVKLGFSSGNQLEVSGDDLRPGDEIVVLGNYELEDGMAIQSAAKGRGENPDAEARP